MQTEEKKKSKWPFIGGMLSVWSPLRAVCRIRPSVKRNVSSPPGKDCWWYPHWPGNSHPWAPTVLYHPKFSHLSLEKSVFKSPPPVTPARLSRQGLCFVMLWLSSKEEGSEEMKEGRKGRKEKIDVSLCV